MDDRRIISLFLERSELAIGRLATKYGKLCSHIAYNILESEADAEECVNDAYLALWNTIPPEKPQYLRAYLLKVLRNIAYDRLDRRNAIMRSSAMKVCLHELEECLPGGLDPESLLEGSIIRDTLNSYLYSLPERDRYLFIRRYYCLESCRAIAKQTGMKESAVSTRLGRLRQELKECLEKEGIYV